MVPQLLAEIARERGEGDGILKGKKNIARL
jgi:hypothetical protein